MSEDRNRNSTGDVYISLEHEWERRSWMQWLHCTEQELRQAVEAIGADPDNVRRFIRQAR